MTTQTWPILADAGPDFTDVGPMSMFVDVGQKLAELGDCGPNVVEADVRQSLIKPGASLEDSGGRCRSRLREIWPIPSRNLSNSKLVDFNSTSVETDPNLVDAGSQWPMLVEETLSLGEVDANATDFNRCRPNFKGRGKPGSAMARSISARQSGRTDFRRLLCRGTPFRNALGLGRPRLCDFAKRPPTHAACARNERLSTRCVRSQARAKCCNAVSLHPMRFPWGHRSVASSLSAHLIFTPRGKRGAGR